MEFTEIDELNDMIIFSKSYRPSLVAKFTKNAFFDLDFKTAQDFNFVSFDELLDNSFDDLTSPEIGPKTSSKIVLALEKSNETIEDILADIGNSIANYEFNLASPLTSPKKKKTEEDFALNNSMKPIQEVEHKKEGSFEAQEAENKIPQIKEQVINEDEGKQDDDDDEDEKEKKINSADEKKNFLKLEKDNVSQTFTEKRKLTSCLTENIKMNKGPVMRQINFFYLRKF